ncbi:MAG: hydroxymethylglutaryl-CoA reductase, degradative [Candidatus Micrarchaeia archaeon]|jgi:hydroxymethylglutaryl-CoA reductase
MASFSGFYKLSRKERLAKIKEFTGLSEEEIKTLESADALSFEAADRMVENAIGTFQLPLGVAVNFVINDREVVVPMATEEPSVIAAASNGAKLALPEGFKTGATDPIMIGQIQLVNVPDAKKSAKEIAAKKKEIIKLANKPDAPMVKYGGGVKEIDVKEYDTPRGKMLVVYLFIDCRDAMGANAVNTFCETLAPEFEKLTGAKARLRILSNFATERIARAKAVWKKEVIGEDAIEGILDAYEFAAADNFRAATHNKGIMNGIDAVVIATGNDWRAVEAGAHAYASMSGRCMPLTKYKKTKSGDLEGKIEIPMAVGLVGGATKTHPTAKLAVKMLGVKSSGELAQIIAAVGLSQNFAALKALSTEGIQRGHMELHARNVAVAAGAKGKQIDAIAEQMISEKNIRVERAKEILGI